MYVTTYKDALTEKAAHTGEEPTPLFDATVRSRGYDPTKDEWSAETRRLQQEHDIYVITEMELLKEPHRVRQQRQRRSRRDRRKR